MSMTPWVSIALHTKNFTTHMFKSTSYFIKRYFSGIDRVQILRKNHLTEEEFSNLTTEHRICNATVAVLIFR